MNNDVLNDALSLSEAIFENIYPDHESINFTIVNIAKNKISTFTPGIDGVVLAYGYQSDESIELLQNFGVFEIGEKDKWFIRSVDTFDRYQNSTEALVSEDDRLTKACRENGYYESTESSIFKQSKVDGLYAVLVNVKLLNRFVKKFDADMKVLYQGWEKLTENKSASFDMTMSKIVIGNKTIDIKQDTNHWELCRCIFKNASSKKKLWNNDELLEKWGGGFESNDSKRKVYDAAREINQKIAQETDIKDFFIFTTKTVQLNPKYL